MPIASQHFATNDVRNQLRTERKTTHKLLEKAAKSMALSVIALSIQACVVQQAVKSNSPKPLVHETLQNLKEVQKSQKELYDHQEIVMYRGDNTSSRIEAIVYPKKQNNITSSFYLINGVSNVGLWYQAGLFHVKGLSNDHYYGLRVSLYYEKKYVQQSLVFNGNILPNDPVQLEMIFYGKNIDISALDLRNLSTVEASVYAFGGSKFIFSNKQNDKELLKKGIFTGIMTEIYSNNPYENKEHLIIYKLLYPNPLKLLTLEEVQRCNSPNPLTNGVKLYKNGVGVVPSNYRSTRFYKTQEIGDVKIGTTDHYMKLIKYIDSQIEIGIIGSKEGTRAVMTGNLLVKKRNSSK